MNELKENGQLAYPYVNNIDNLASFFTEPLSTRAFTYMRNRVMNVGSRAPSGHEERGGVASTEGLRYSSSHPPASVTLT